MRERQGNMEQLGRRVVASLVRHAVMSSQRDKAMSEIEQSFLTKFKDIINSKNFYQAVTLRLRFISKLTKQILSDNGPFDNVLGRARQLLLNKREISMKRERDNLFARPQAN
jgi:hypothetical protein